jgi:hypothetical protein
MAKKKKADPVPEKPTHHLLHDAEGAASGAVAGAVFGAIAGPPGVVAGAVIGAVAGAIAASALDSEAEQQSERTRVLDAEIGVSGGDLGAPNLKHPPAIVGAYSGASVVADAPDDEEAAEGPMQTPET